MASYIVDIRQRRQVTLPYAALRELGVDVSDSLEIELTKSGAILKPKKQVALNALAEIQRVFSKADISEGQMLKFIAKNRQS